MSRKLTREELVTEIKRLCEELGRVPKITDMDSEGKFSRGPYNREFGGWTAALQAAGLEPHKRENIPREELIDAIHDLREQLGRVPTRKDMTEHGEFSRGPYDREFGGWNNALEAAGLEKNKPVQLSREELLSELERLAAAIDRVPRQKDINERGEYSTRAYKRVWENWNAALRAAGFDPNKKHGEKVTLTCEYCGEEYQVKPALEDNSRFCSRDCDAEYKAENYDIEDHPHPHAGKRVTKKCEWCGDEFEVNLYKKDSARFCSLDCLGAHNGEVRSGEDSPRWRGGYEPYYGPNWRKQRRRRREKDDHTCQRCGATEDLVVHHKTPFREFVGGDAADYESAHRLENLVTLCRNCHSYVENNAENAFGA